MRRRPPTNSPDFPSLFQAAGAADEDPNRQIQLFTEIIELAAPSGFPRHQLSTPKMVFPMSTSVMALSGRGRAYFRLGVMQDDLVERARYGDLAGADFVRTMELGHKVSAFCAKLSPSVVETTRRQMQTEVVDAFRYSATMSVSGLLFVDTPDPSALGIVEGSVNPDSIGPEKAVQSAFRFIDMAQELNPRDPFVCRDRARILHIAGRNVEALEALNQAQTLYESAKSRMDADSWNHRSDEKFFYTVRMSVIRARILFSLERFEDCVRHATAALQEDPPVMPLRLKRDFVYKMRGAARFRLGQYAEALEDFDAILQVAEVSSARESGHRGRGIVLHEMGRHEEAISEFSFSEESGQLDFMAYSRRAHSRASLGELDAAVSDVTSAIGLCTGDEKAPYLLQRVAYFLSLADPEAALRDALVALEMLPGGPTKSDLEQVILELQAGDPTISSQLEDFKSKWGFPKDIASYSFFAKKKRCENCGGSKSGLQKCSQCKAVRYCSRECQRAHWRAHKKSCRRVKSS